MPIREFHCEPCDRRIEVIQTTIEVQPATCNECGEPMTRQFSTAAAHFRGAGFYATDYGKKRPKKKTE